MKRTLAAAAIAALVALGGLGIMQAFAENPENFTLPRVGEGEDFELAKAKGKIVALHFLLKTECPVCLRHTAEYHRRSAEETPDVIQVFIKPDSEEQILEWIRDTSSDGPAIYRDADAALAKAFSIPDGYQFHGEVVHYPALVLLDKDGKEFYRYVGKNNSDRVEFGKFKELVIPNYE